MNRSPKNASNSLEISGYFLYKHPFAFEKIMKSDRYCSGCSQKDTCRSAYEKLGKFQGPNVAWKVIVAFWVPIGVFIGGLAASQRLLRGRIEGRALILVSFVLAVSLTWLVICVIRAINARYK
ncbi:MAG: hypothetical protein ACYSOU_02455 [Planctomycetota bacterium]